MHNREVSIEKKKLIEKIKNNKAAHILEYTEAVTAYKLEAKKQLKDLQYKLNHGELDLHLQLVKPVDRTSKFDKLIEMFEWEVDDIIKLSSDEFNEYVHDDTYDATTARFANASYMYHVRN